MFEDLKAVAKRAAEMWTGADPTDEFGRPTSITLPNGITVGTKGEVASANSLKRAPTDVVDDWYASTQPEAARNFLHHLPLPLLGELWLNAAILQATCPLNQRVAAEGIVNMVDLYAYEYGIREMEATRAKSLNHYRSAEDNVGKDPVEPATLDKRGHWHLPADQDAEAVRDAALANVKAVAVAIGQLRDPNPNHQVFSPICGTTSAASRPESPSRGDPHVAEGQRPED